MRKVLAIILTCIMLIGCIPQVLASEAAEPTEKSGLSFTQDKIYLCEDQRAILDLQGVSLPNPNITFESEDTTVVDVDQAGFVSAKGQGITTITAKQNTGSTATCTVVVSNYVEFWCDFNPSFYGGSPDYISLNYDWNLDDWDGDGYSWMMASDDIYSVSRDDYAVCFNGGPGGYQGNQSDDTLTSYSFSLPDDAASATLTFEAGKLSSCSEQLYIYIADDVSGNYTDVFDVQPYVKNITSYGSTYSIDMTEFLGCQGIRIAFDYYADECYGLYLDNIGVFVEYEIIDEIVIDDLSAEPVVGHVAGDYLTYSYPAYADYYVEEIDWRDKDGSVGFDEEFQSGVEYYLHIRVNVDDYNFRFSPEAAIILNGGDVDYNHSTWFTYVALDGESYYINIGTMYAIESGNTPIELVEITNVNLNPIAGEIAGNYMSLSFASNPHSTLIIRQWYNDTKHFPLEPQDTFEAWDYYSFNVVLEPSGGYFFPSDMDSITITINGSSEIIDSDTYTHEDGTLHIWTKPIRCGEPGDETPIELVALGNVTLNPPAGEVSGHYHTFSFENDSHCNFSNMQWYNDTGEYALSPDDKFIEGDYYRFGIVFEPHVGYRFPADVENITITINGSSDNVDYERSFVDSEDGYLHIWTKPVLCREPGEIIPIELVDISGVMLDIHDGMRESECLAYKLNTANCSVIEVVWFDDTIHDYLPSDGTFTEGHSYFIGIKLAADEGYCFTADTKAKLNGSAENVGDGYLYEDDFIVKSKLIVCGAHLDIMIGDVNGDGKVNTSDAVIILKVAAGMASLEGDRLIAANTNHDSKVNTSDAVLILKYAAGMIDSF